MKRSRGIKINCVWTVQLVTAMEFSCDHCDVKFKFNRSLKSHMVAAHQQIKSEKMTKETEETVKETVQPRDQTGPGDEFRCDTCGKTFKQKTHLTRHVESLHLGIKYPCQLCNYKASQISNLVTHTETVHEKKQYSCKLCPFEARTRFAVRRHNREEHHGQKGVNKKTLQCQTCNKSFAFEKRLNFHMKRQHGIFDYQTRKQRKSRIQKERLNDEKPEFDQIVISHVQSLQDTEVETAIQSNSEASEERKEEFSCNLCEKKFTQRGHLQVHMESLHNGQRFPCSHCGKEFRQKPHLQRHVESVHLGVRYKCDQCDHQSTQISNLVTHKEMVHENKIYFCKFCEFHAKSRTQVRKHKNRHHKGSTAGKLTKKLKFLKKKKQLGSLNTNNVRNSTTNDETDSSTKLSTGVENIQNEVIIEFSLEAQVHYCDLCLYDSKEENELTNHLATEHYEEILGRAIVVPAIA